MNVKNNRRKQESARRITDAFLEEIKSKELARIKVSDICKKADVNRSTFYASYTDVYDLADRILSHLEADVNKLFDDGIDFNFSEESFLRLFCHIKENQDLYNTYFKLGFESENLRLFDMHKIEDEHYRENIEYHIVFFKNGFNAVVRHWLKGGCKESPEQMCDILLYEYRGRFHIE